MITAEGGDAAVALLTGAGGARIDCVVLDLVMPDLDGSACSRACATRASTFR